MSVLNPPSLPSLITVWASKLASNCNRVLLSPNTEIGRMLFLSHQDVSSSHLATSSTRMSASCRLGRDNAPTPPRRSSRSSLLHKSIYSCMQLKLGNVMINIKSLRNEIKMCIIGTSNVSCGSGEMMSGASGGEFVIEETRTIVCLYNTIQYNTIFFYSNNKHSNGCNSRDNIYSFSDVKRCFKGIHKKLKKNLYIMYPLHSYSFNNT